MLARVNERTNDRPEYDAAELATFVHRITSTAVYYGRNQIDLAGGYKPSYLSVCVSLSTPPVGRGGLSVCLSIYLSIYLSNRR